MHVPLGSHTRPERQSELTVQRSTQTPALQTNGAHERVAPLGSRTESPSSVHVAVSGTHLLPAHVKPLAQLLESVHPVAHRSPSQA